MSIQAVAWVLDHSTAEWGARLALISIANHADKRGGNAYPSFATIAEEARMSRRRVISAVQRLEAGGHVILQRGRGPGGAHIYVIAGMPAAGDESSLPKTDTGDAASDATGDDQNIAPFNEPLTVNHLRPETKFLVGFFAEECDRLNLKALKQRTGMVGAKVSKLLEKGLASPAEIKEGIRRAVRMRRPEILENLIADIQSSESQPAGSPKPKRNYENQDFTDPERMKI